MASSGQYSYQCTYCPYLAHSLSQRVDHYKYVHSNQPGFEIVCYVDNCPKKYTNMRALTNHIKSKHPEAGKNLVKRNVSGRGLDVLQGPHNDNLQDIDPMSDQEENNLD